MTECIHYFLHVDMDAFFASVEQLDHPEWKGKPVIVGGNPADRRSVVSTASYEARKFGVHSAMPSVQAYRLCPHGIFTCGRMKRYAEMSAKIMDILGKYSPDVEKKSIDEACVDLTGTEKLFGEPSETALKIKQEIFNETGLTVSLGLASTRYLAKIASEIKKPDGFFRIFPGDEEKFILSFPLEKIWGIGEKTLQRLHKAGFYTTKQIREQNKDLLCMLFGNAAGNFLYNTVRGIETETPQKPVSRSISAETTFPFDLTDKYTAETALMELSYTVMFRLLREKAYSKTVMVKIRYEDFTTITVQETAENFLTSTDDLYMRACSLFEKKYETGRGIRLLGIGAENLEDESRQQEVLFDFGEKKKQAVEKAILTLEKKHPAVKVRKARLLNMENSIKSAAAFFIISAAAVSLPGRIFSEESVNETNASGAGTLKTLTEILPLPVESPATLFDYTIKDNAIEFLASGYWQGEFTGTANASFGGNSGFAISSGPPVFKQEVDLSLWFMLNRQWYFEAAFADQFNKNTVAAGWYGRNALKEIKIANRGIVFPASYSADTFSRGIGGGKNQAPGIYAHFEDPAAKRWRADIALRYDMTEAQNATFYGKNSVTAKQLELSDYMTGRLFVMPSPETVSGVTAVYVESSNGSYRDNSGRKYRRLLESEYMLQPARCQIILSKDAGAMKKNGRLPSVIVSLNSSGNLGIGSWDEEDSFLGKIQKFFGSVPENSKDRKPDLKKFAYEYDCSTAFQGDNSAEKKLMIQSPDGFSPFVCAFRYDCGIKSAADVMIASSSTEKRSENYTVSTADDADAFVTSDFFSDKHAYADVYSSSTHSYSQTAALEPNVRYPLADRNPGYYLNYKTSSDLMLFVRTYTPVSRYDIGTDVSGGSVRVYKNGILDSGAKYDSDSGTVTPSVSVSDMDKIYITWNKDISTAENGAIAAEAAFAYNFTPFLTGDIALSANWTVSPYIKYADSEKAAPGFIAVTTGLSYKTENIELSNAAAASLESENVTGIYRILGMDQDASETYYLGQNSGHSMPEKFAPILNARGFSNAQELDADKNRSAASGSVTGSADTGISGYKIPLEWKFTGNQSGEWAAVSIKLSQGQLLSSGTEFQIALKAETPGVTGYDVYLQLGVNADENFETETRKKIPTWKISDSAADDVKVHFNTTGGGWQTVCVYIKDEDRARFSELHDARIIAVANTEAAISGIISAGPYKIITKPVFTSQNGAFNITAEQRKDNSIPNKSEFNTDTNYIQSISWQKNSTTLTAGADSNITLAKYFEGIDIAPYDTANFYFKYTHSDEEDIAQSSGEPLFTFILDRDAESINENGKIAVKAVLSDKAINRFISNTEIWHKFSINFSDRTVSIDDMELSAEEYNIPYLNTNILPSRMKIILNTAVNGKLYKKGEFCFDELNLKGSSPYFLFQDTAKVKIKKDGLILAAGSFPVLENLSFEAKATGAAAIRTHKKTADSAQSISGNAAAGARFATINTSVNAEISSSDSNVLVTGGHNISTSKPLLGVLSFSENFVFNHADSSLEKENKAGINLKKIHIPLDISAYAKSAGSQWSITQSAGADSNLSFGGKNWNTELAVSASVSQKQLPSSSEVNDINTNNYFTGWLDSTKLSFSGGEETASNRTGTASARLSAKLPFASFTPYVSMKLNGKYTATSYVLFTDSTTVEAALPFRIKSSSFSFKWTKEGGGVSPCSKGGSYASDYSMLQDTIPERSWYFKACPFYDLFSSRLADEVLADTSMTKDSADSLYYSANYSFLWRRQVYADMKDLWIPASAQITAARDLRTASDISDIYQIKAVIANTPFNLFGSESRIKLFKWYKNDEFSSSFAGTVKIPAASPANTTYELAFYVQAGFFINNSDVLKAGAQFKIDTDSSWNTQETLQWTRSGRTSPILDLIKVFRPNIKSSEIKLTRNDSMDFSFQYTASDKKKKQTYAIAHSLDVKLLKYFTLNLGLSGTFTYTTDSAALLSLTASAGGKIEF